jgi:hypothetical protein
MASDFATSGLPDHPSPHRGHVATASSVFVQLGGPLAWAAQFTVGYGLASHACFPHAAPLNHLLHGWEHIAVTLLAINAVALLVAASAAAVSWRNWRVTRAEHHGHYGQLLEIGEGRSRFLAVCGMMTSLGFLAAIAFNTLTLLTVPPCSG